MSPRRWLLATLMVTSCTGRRPETPPPSPEAVNPPPATAEPGETETVPEEEPLPAADVDSMDEPALEAACFAGRQAACDLLGH